MKNTSIKLLLSSGAILLLIIHLAWPQLQIDAITLGLAFFAALPWLPAVLESAELPGGWKVQFRALAVQQSKQQSDIDTLKFLVGHFVTDDELNHLRRLESGDPFIIKKDASSSFFESEMRRLRALGLIAGYPGKGIRSLFQSDGNVKQHFYITENGREYLKLRQQVDEKE
jgi:hypothetical protein